MKKGKALARGLLGHPGYLRLAPDMVSHSPSQVNTHSPVILHSRADICACLCQLTNIECVAAGCLLVWNQRSEPVTVDLPRR
ncbi:hypothetical protein C0Q70_09898 [Pomacea canaliculata]|uniref:Uncharacterized protein n=1 Tax=Pomacea canaliculata TaxID=400727 RepID=A0A2T7PB23_POMCA|nr:hypothetical protein C0Q70_09898 [Pomacea canaliculata]